MNADTVKKLREKTGAGIMECKKALEDAKGNLEGAEDLIKERGLRKAGKKADRGTGAGFVKAYVHHDRVGVLLDIRAETDFVVKSEPFQELAQEVAMQVAAMNPEDTAELLKQPYVRDTGKTVENLIKGTIAKVGENISVERFCRYEV